MPRQCPPFLYGVRVLKTNTGKILAQLDALSDFYSSIRPGPEGVPDYTERAHQFIMMCLSTIERIAGPDSTYASRARSVVGQPAHAAGRISMLYGVIQALREDVASERLAPVQGAGHMDLFSEYLEQADYLLEKDYKDASAIMAGGVLEAHLRRLCARHGIDTDEQTTGGRRRKKASILSADLYKAKILSLREYQQVKTWLALRNDAARGNFDGYVKEEVARLVQSVWDFVRTHPI
jgi:hypothetical protein